MLVKDYPITPLLKAFMSNFDFTLLELKNIPIFLLDEMIDSYVPLRGVFSDEISNYGLYYNTILVNNFRKILFCTIYFLILLPISLIARKLFGKDSDTINSWPDKYFFSGTTILFYAIA